MSAAEAPIPWQDALFETLRAADIRQFAYVPDAGHASVRDQPDFVVRTLRDFLG